MTRKMIKKATAIILVFALSLGMCTTVSAQESESDREHAINVLLESGWTMEEIDYYLTEETLLAYADVESAGEIEEHYYHVTEDEIIEVTEEECMEAVVAIEEERAAIDSGISTYAIGDTYKEPDESSDGYMKYYIQASRVSTDKYMLSARYEWLITPWSREIDVFAITYSDSLSKDNSFATNYVYKTDRILQVGSTFDESTKRTYETTTPTKMYTGNTGVATCQDLYDDVYLSATERMVARNHRGYLQFRVVDAVKGGSNSYSACMFYAHQESYYQVSPSITIEDLGVSLSPASSFKVMDRNPQVTFYQ